MKKSVKKPIDFVYWFRKCLRVHDNQGLSIAAQSKTTKNMLNIFIIDPYFWEKRDIHENRLNFLLDSLRELDENLRTKGS
jgi:cryptochrome